MIKLSCGSITGTYSIKNPISLARKVMESNKVVLLSGEGAEKFADKFSKEEIERQPSTYFINNKSMLMGTVGKNNNK